LALQVPQAMERKPNLISRKLSILKPIKNIMDKPLQNKPSFVHPQWANLLILQQQ
jgi:hypothetical protein